LPLLAGLVLAVSASLATPGLAQKSDISALSVRINELSRAGKYSEAMPLAQDLVASLEKGNNSRDLAAALNNLGQLHGSQGQDDRAEPLFTRTLAIYQKGRRTRASCGRNAPEQSRPAL
jgi:tetratricopeptide (TPR) repeat protein